MLASDDEIRAELRAITEGVPDRPDLLQAVTSAGRARRRRRQFVSVTLTAMVVAGVAIGVTTLVASHGSDHKSNTLTLGASGTLTGPVTDPRLLNWPARGDQASDQAFQEEAMRSQENNPNTTNRIESAPHLLFAGDVPGAKAAIIEGINASNEVVVAALATPSNQPDGSLEVIEARVIAAALPKTNMQHSVSFAVTHAAQPGFLLIVGAPGTDEIQFSVQPGPSGPEFRDLTVQDGVGSSELPAAPDFREMFYAVQQSGRVDDYSYVMFGGTQH